MRLVGENGAGKSTLMRVLGGEMAPSSGEIRIDGKPVSICAARAAARAHGIAIIHQELALAPDLSVAENIFLRELSRFISWRHAPAARPSSICSASTISRRAPPRLTLAHQQVVEIAKALSWQVKVIVFDEPTAVLWHRMLNGCTSHRAAARPRCWHRLHLPPAGGSFQVADRVTVMKDGVCLPTCAPPRAHDRRYDPHYGRPADVGFVPGKGERKIGEERLSSADLHRGRLVRDISFSLRAGEIVGLGGLVGSGRSEVARVIFGADRLDSGAILLNGVERKIRSPSEAVKAGVCLVPEDRKAQGVVLDAPIRVNATMARLSAW